MKRTSIGMNSSTVAMLEKPKILGNQVVISTYNSQNVLDFKRVINSFVICI